jgi:2-polyprenyl-6-methoxyphenol hydroxylase-like FAD-dependent oxidoreductase
MTIGSLRIAVIGGGIGGLTAALALRQAGFDVDVYE